MARGLKTRGTAELATLRRRIARQLALGRIFKVDHDYLIDLTNKMEARIVSMHETDDQEGDDRGW